MHTEMTILAIIKERRCNEMKKYEKPEMQIIKISASDVITTSGISGGGATGSIGGGGNIED